MKTEQPRRTRILIADDEPLYLRTTGQLLRKAGYECECVSNAQAALDRLNNAEFDLILSDLNMPGNLKLELLRQGREQWPQIPLIVVTGVPSLPTAIESLRIGIADYLLKPVKFEDLLSSICRVLDHARRESEPVSPTSLSRFAGSNTLQTIAGSSRAMDELRETIFRVAGTDSNVLISGESGTGKEVVAKAIHNNSQRRDHNFEVIDCTAIPESLFESVLFGHVKGAFTGAIRDQQGLLSKCDQGTAFFDELGELPISSQAKLLRVVQEQAFTPIGKTEQIFVNTRYICATNRDLQVEIKQGQFREDLFYRLGVINIELPPLRERGNDILELAELFLKDLQNREGRVSEFATEVIDRFLIYRWPGNIRELRNVVERAIALCQTEIVTVKDLPKPLREMDSDSVNESSLLTEISREEALDNADQLYLAELLMKHKGNVAKVARQAGMSRQGIHKLLVKHGISAADFRN